MKKGKNEEANLAQDTCDSESDHMLLISTVEHAKGFLCGKLVQDKCDKKSDHMLMSNATDHEEDDSCSWYLDTGVQTT